MFTKLLIALRCAFLLCLPLLSFAQGSAPMDLPRAPRLVDLDTPAVLSKGGISGNIDVRFLGGNEDSVYTSLGVGYGLGHGWEAVVRSAFAERKSLLLPGSAGTIRHGGNDVELLAKYQLPKQPGIAGFIGIAFPGTPAQGGAVLTLGGAGAVNVTRGVTAYINPKAVFLDSNTIFGIGLGLRARLSDRIALIADWTPLVSGDNTRNTTTGARTSRDIYGAALRFTDARDNFSLDLGYSNGTGATTGASLTSGLGGSGAFYFSITARR